jgi:adenylate cyclase
LAERGEIEGDPGAYVCMREINDVHVPPTLQAAIGARIDRLTPGAKRTLNAAAVIGARFRADLLGKLIDGPEFTPLIEAELIDQIGLGQHTEYAFHHPLTQKVAYESQLKVVRSQLHRRAAAIIQQRDGAMTGEIAAIIATHYEAAGDQRDAFDWYMRAATWYGARDIRAARGGWQLARRVADHLPENDPERLSMRIAPRALLCGSSFEVGGTPAETGFDELRILTTEAGDKKSLAVGMAGHLATLTFNSHYRDAADMASEFAGLLDSIGDPALIVGSLWSAAQAKWEAGQATESLRLAQRIIDLARGDLTMGNFVIASPLAWATMLKGVSRMFLGRQGWRRDLEEGIALAQSFNPATRALAQLYKYVGAVVAGALVPDADDVSFAAKLLETSERSGDDTAVTYSLMSRAITLIYSPAGDRAEGLAVLAQAREMIVREQLTTTLLRNCDIELAREMSESGDCSAAIATARRILDEQFDTGEMIIRGPATTVLVEALLGRGLGTDLQSARQAVDRLAAVPTDPGFVLHELPVLRLRALLARACGDELGYRRFVTRFHASAHEAEFEGYLAQAKAMA